MLKDIKAGKLSLRKENQRKKSNPNKLQLYVLISASTKVNMKVWLMEGLETAAVWFSPSCTLKYLAPMGRGPCSHSFTTKISSVLTLTESTVFYKVIMPFRILGGISFKD